MIIMYSIMDRTSFEEVMSFYQQLLRVKGKDYFPMLLVGNKADLESERNVSIVAGRKMAASFGCPFVERSAETGGNEERVFHDMMREIRHFNQFSSAALQCAWKFSEVSSQVPRGLGTVFSTDLSFSSIKDISKPSKPNWNLGSRSEKIWKQTLDDMLIRYALTNDKRRATKALEHVADKNVEMGIKGNALHAVTTVGYLGVVSNLIRRG